MQRALTLIAVALATSCGGKRSLTPPSPPLAIATLSVELPSELGALRFATASADGNTVGLMFASGAVVVRGREVGPREGQLVPGTSPMFGRTEGDEVHFVEQIEGTEYRAPAHIGAATGGDWNDPETLWRLAAGKPGAGLLRAVNNRDGSWSAIDFHGPGEAMPRWHVERVADGSPAFVVDAALAHDASLALVQLTDRKGAGRLVAYETVTGSEAWTVDTAATFGHRGALLISDDGATVTTVLADVSRCKTCAKIEVREVATGEKVARVQLDPAVDVLARLGVRGIETTVGRVGDELWLRSLRPPDACTFDVLELGEGTVRPTHPEWRARFADCATAVRALPVHGGVLGVRVVDARHVELLRFDRLP